MKRKNSNRSERDSRQQQSGSEQRGGGNRLDQLSPEDIQHRGADSIIQGIQQEAQQEADKLIEQAEKSASDRRKSWEKQAERIMQEAGQEAEERAEEIWKAGQSRLAVELKKRRLQLHEQAVNEVINQALSDIEKMIGSEAYTAVLEDLITEAALGIRADKAVVLSSAKEASLITDTMLKTVRERVKETSGRDIRLTFSSDEPLSGQGIMLKSEDGSVAFSNQIRVRLLRYQSEIRHLIYRKLLSETSDTAHTSGNSGNSDTSDISEKSTEKRNS